MLNSIKHKIKSLVYKIIPPPAVNESFSQAGEDLCIEFLLKEIGINHISYLELGVCDPIQGSNTYRFYKRGFSGVLVEADQTLIPKIKKFRKRDTVLNFGVGFENNAEADFYIFEVAAHNTFDKEEAENRCKNGSYKLIRIEKVKLVTVEEILQNHFQNKIPDILSIDIEGLDLKVLQTINFDKFPIPIICAETCTYSENHIRPKDRLIENYMKSSGYFVYADTYINTIFVNDHWFHSIKKKK